MKKYKIKSVPTKHGAFIRRRIDKSRRRAELVGMTYLFALLALTGLTCMSLLETAVGATGIKSALTVAFLHDFGTVASKLEFLTAGLYLFTLMFLGIGLLRALTCLKNLFKKKVSRVYGLNANIDAMETLGKIFSASISCIVITHTLIYVLCDSAAALTLAGYAVAGLGLAIHFICGFVGGKVSVFYIDEETGVSESKRPYGRFIPLFRNVLQLAAVGVITYAFIKYSQLYDTLIIVLTVGVQPILVGGHGLLPVALEGLSILWLMGMIGHALNTSEYSVEGPYASGIRNFRVFSILMFLTAGGALAWKYLFGAAVLTLQGSQVVATLVKSLDNSLVIISGIALVMTVSDFVLKLRWTKEALAEQREENKQIVPNINITTPKQPINIQVPQQQTPEINVHTPATKPVEAPPININLPAAQTKDATPIHVNMPAAQTQTPAPISINMPAAKARKKESSINVNMPAAQTQKPTPINISMPAAQTQKPTPINVSMPKVQPTKTAPISINMPAAQADRKSVV